MKVKNKNDVNSFIDKYLIKNGDCYEYYNPDIGSVYSRVTKIYRYKNKFICRNHKQIDIILNFKEFEDYIWKNRKYINEFNKNKEHLELYRNKEHIL